MPYRLLKAFQKVHPRLVRELEKKFSGKDVVLVANRRIQPKPSTGMAKARPRSRTLTSVRAQRAACAVCCPCTQAELPQRRLGVPAAPCTQAELHRRGKACPRILTLFRSAACQIGCVKVHASG